MCALPNRTKPNLNSEISDEDIVASKHLEGKSQDYSNLIRRANKRSNLFYILTKLYGLQVNRAGQFDTWSRSITCPFPTHKGGYERTGSFGYNFAKDYFHCFGCGQSGGAVEFLSTMESVPRHLVAEQVLRETGGYDTDDDLEDNENPKIEKLLFDFSKFLQELYLKHKDNSHVITQLDKVTWWFDLYLLIKVPRNRVVAVDLEQRINKATELLEKYK